MELRQLNTFRTVARTLSFTRTAHVLDYAQSSVTAQIKSLEEDLGVPLFERLGKRVALTDAGERLLTYAEKLLRLAEEARVAVPADDEPRGTLSIGAPESLCAYRLPPVLSRFRARFPHVQLIFQPNVCNQVRRALSDGLLDVGLLMEHPVQHNGLVIEQLVREPLLILVYPGHPLTRLPHVGPGDLAGEPVVVTEAGCSYREMFERTLADAGARPATSLEFGSIEAIKQCVMAGMGITFLPEVTVTAELAQGWLVALPWTGPEHTVMTQIAWHKDKWLSPALRAFIDLTRGTLRAGSDKSETGAGPNRERHAVG